ncbi:helix-turn-helix domain-containing protein [Novosphingobium sp. Gsoil 351]|nr:helix-turn-helix domain-containing protein [Novosphingobium sp. Gsoil 351]
MIDYARNHLDGSITLPTAARLAQLSDDRARHLFVKHTGLPFKTFVLWLRLERAVAKYAGGSSLTEAAHDAGFADSAHLSRTFRRTFGLPAAALRLVQALATIPVTANRTHEGRYFHFQRATAAMPETAA